jgi:SAM-dependent methyltransferase
VSINAGQTVLARRELERARRSRRHARRTQFDYLHLRRLVDDLARALAEVETPVRDVLDVYCGSRPYDDLLPPGARCVGLDVEGNPYNVADVVSNEFLPFDDASFDLVTCIEAFQYVEDAERGVREIRRVLRPGGTALISLPFAWEYDRSFLEHRYTGPALEHLFRGWDDVRVVENGGRGIVWTTLTGTMLERFRLRLPAPARLLFAPLYIALNVCGSVLDRLEQRHATGTVTLPMNLLLTARRPKDG